MLWTISFLTGSVYFFFFGVGLTLEQLWNALLRYAIDQDGLNGAEHQMPARSSELAVYFATMIILFVLTYQIKSTTYRTILLGFAQVFVIYARIYLEINTNIQMLVGALVGFVDAIIQSAIIYYVIAKHIDKIKGSKIYSWFGLTDKWIHVLDNYDKSYYKQRKLQDIILFSGMSKDELKAFLADALYEPGEVTLHHKQTPPVALNNRKM